MVLPLALMGIRAAELPTAAAIRLGDKIFTGKTHAAALMDADLTTVQASVFDSGAISDGFLTNFGRFVSRDEAAGLAGLRGIRDRWGTRRFHSDQLKR